MGPSLGENGSLSMISGMIRFVAAGGIVVIGVVGSENSLTAGEVEVVATAEVTVGDEGSDGNVGLSGGDVQEMIFSF